MDETSPKWVPWGDPYIIEGEVESVYDHKLVEVLFLPGHSESQVIRPSDVRWDADMSRVLWRPMIWLWKGKKNYRIFNSFEPACISLAKDGFLLHGLHSVFEQIYYGMGLSDTGARKWVETTRRRMDFCAQHGAIYRLVIIPEPHVVYPDVVPGRPDPSADRPIMRILRDAPPDIREAIIYPVEEMMAGRARHDTFPLDDVHFTFFAAFLAYRALIESLPCCSTEQALQEKDLVFHEGPRVGGLGRALRRDRHIARYVIPPRTPHEIVVKDNRFGPGRVDVFETPHPELPSLVVFRTSNTTNMYPYLLHSFSRITAVAGQWFMPDLIESESPTVVIMEITERYIAPRAGHEGYDQDQAPDDQRVQSFDSLTGFTLPLPRGGDRSDTGS